MILSNNKRPKDEHGELLTDQYSTPEDVVNMVRGFWGLGKPILDLAGSESNKKAPFVLTREQNSLNVDWADMMSVLGMFEFSTPNPEIDKSLAWLQPPYSKELLGKFVKKAYFEAGAGMNILALLPVSTSTKWFHKYIYTLPPCNYRFIEGRIKFIPPPGLELKENRPMGDNIAVYFTSEVCNKEEN